MGKVVGGQGGIVVVILISIQGAKLNEEIKSCRESLVRKYLYFILLSLIIVGCSNQKKLSHTFSDNDVSIEISAQYESNESITLNISNKGISTISYGGPYTIEEFRKGQWIELPFIENLAFTSGAVLLPPNELHDSIIFLEHLDADLIPGQRYRIIKTITIEDRQSEITLAAEFTVSDE